MLSGGVELSDPDQAEVLAAPYLERGHRPEPRVDDAEAEEHVGMLRDDLGDVVVGHRLLPGHGDVRGVHDDRIMLRRR